MVGLDLQAVSDAAPTALAAPQRCTEYNAGMVGGMSGACLLEMKSTSADIMRVESRLIDPPYVDVLRQVNVGDGPLPRLCRR